MNLERISSSQIGELLAGAGVLLGLYLTSLYSYLLFHSLAEIVSIVVAAGIFVLAWNSRRFLDNGYFILLGVAFLFIGGIDLLHTLAYAGMGVFQGYGTNLPTQLWIAGRYLQSLSLLAAPFFVRRKPRVALVLAAYAVVVSALLASIFLWNIFPVCYIDGVGLTPFKKDSEYVISLILVAAIGLLLRERRSFDPDVLSLLVGSIGVSIASELTFTSYVSVYDLANLAGHMLKLIAFYLVYKAIIVTGLVKPYDLVFRELKQRTDALRAAKDELEVRVAERTAELRDVNAELRRELIERMRVEEELHRFFTLSPDLLCIAGFDGYLKELSPAWEKTLGFSIDELKSKPYVEFVHPEDRQRTADGAQSLASLSGTVSFENRYLCRDGSYRWLSWNATASTERRLIYAVARDATERRRWEQEIRQLNAELELRVAERTAQLQAANDELEAEIVEHRKAEEEIKKLNENLKQHALKLEAANRELEAFSYSISHDLRQPLTSINAFAGLAREDYGEQMPPQAQHYLELVQKASKEMAALIDGLLSFSRLGRQPLKKQAVAPADIVRQVVDDLCVEHKGREVEIVIKDLPPCQADPLLLKQVYANLLSNAFKFTRNRKQARIEVGCRTDGGKNVYYVRDNGVGFDMAQAQRLFGVFQRLHRPDEYEGTGVGLAIVERIIRRHGGQIQAESEVEKGATFSFTL